MSVPWAYRLAVGTTEGGVLLDWETTSGTPAPDFTTGGSPGLVLDGCTLVRRLPEGEPWPCQPDPAVLTFQVAAPSAAELADQLVGGAPVAYRIGQWRDDIDRWALADWFTGYISDVQLEAREGYTVATVTAMDWVAQLAEVVVGDSVWPVEAAETRIGRVFGLVGTQAPELPNSWGYDDASDVPVVGDHVGLSERDVDARTALDLLLEITRCWAVRQLGLNDWTYSRYRLQLQHGISGQAARSGPEWNGTADTFTELLDFPTHVWRLSLATANPNTTQPPAVFGDIGGGVWGVVMDPDTPWGSWLSGDTVELPVRWSQRIGGVPNVAIVVVDFPGYAAGQGKYVVRWQLPQAERKPRVKVKLDVPLDFAVANDASYIDGVTAAFNLAFLLIPDTVNPRTSWGTDELTYSAAHEDGFHTWPFVLGNLITITDVDPDAHPQRTPWLHGQLDSYTVRITDGFPRVDFTTRPQLRDSIWTGTGEVLRMEDIPAGVTLAELDPTLTLHDLRLLRAAP